MFTFLGACLESLYRLGVRLFPLLLDFLVTFSRAGITPALQVGDRLLMLNAPQ